LAEGARTDLTSDHNDQKLHTADRSFSGTQNEFPKKLGQNEPASTADRNFSGRQNDVPKTAEALANQLGRRNPNPDQASMLRGRRYNRVKKQREDNLKQNTPKGHCDPSVNAAEVLAKEHGVSPRTIKRDGQFAEAVEKVEALDPEITKKVIKGEAPARSHIIKAAKLMDEHPEKAAGYRKPPKPPWCSVYESTHRAPVVTGELARKTKRQYLRTPRKSGRRR